MRRIDPNGTGLAGHMYGLPFTPEESRVLLVPVPWEATASYGEGASRAPAAILAASRQVELLDRQTGRPYQAAIAMLPIPEEVLAWSEAARRVAAPVIQAGGPGDDAGLKRAAAAVDAACERMNGWVHEEVARRVEEGKLVGVVGGDHSVSYGAIRALAEAHPGIGVLHLDAHADLRDAYQGLAWSHASVMYNVLRDLGGVARIVQVGVRDYCDAEGACIEQDPFRLRTYFDPDLRAEIHEGEGWASIAGRIVADLPWEVYLSFDIDGLDPSLCPNTGTPVPGGLSFAEITTLLRVLSQSGRRILGFDLTEVAPDASGRSEWDANVGARLLYKQIGFALLSQRG